jgi:hypothetical protein
MEYGQQQLYDNNKRQKDEENNEKYSEKAAVIDGMIDIILDNLSQRSNHNNGNFSWLFGDKKVEVSFETNVFGTNQRYEAEITSPCTDGNEKYGWRNVDFSYYHGYINQFVSFGESVCTFTTELKESGLSVFLDAIRYLNASALNMNMEIFDYLKNIENENEYLSSLNINLKGKKSIKPIKKSLPVEVQVLLLLVAEIALGAFYIFQK